MHNRLKSTRWLVCSVKAFSLYISNHSTSDKMLARGIVYEYEDGGRYVGEWDKDASNGYGVCTGPRGHGVYEGLWEQGFQVSGVYTWPNGMRYMGPWSNNMRDGTGKEERPDGTEYSGDFTQGFRGPYGVSKLPNGVFRGTWSNGAQDGEGVERYLDGGVYRGEYKKGVRHGFGTRTSRSYEHRHSDSALTGSDYSTLPKRGSEPALERAAGTITKQESSASVFSAQMGTTVKDRAGSIFVNSAKPSSGQDLNAQIYEGEWREDRRHGHGVLKVLGHYTYYGDWENNNRTGYGVLVHDNGKKEEGQWQNGKLIVVLKRRKLAIKNSQLETNIRQAHTKAIQAADMARNKALLAESRAVAASTKSKQANTFAQDAVKNAQLARERAELYKNAPRVSESCKTPMVTDKALTFPEVDLSFPTSSSPRPQRSSNTKGSLNDVLDNRQGHTSLYPPSSSVSTSPSFENFQNYQEGGSDSGENSDDERRDLVTSMTDSYSTNSLRRRRDQFKKQDSGMYSTSSLEEGRADTPSRKRRLERRKSDPPEYANNSKRSVKHSRSGSMNEDGEGDPAASLTRRDKTTGEMNHGDLTDDEDDKNRPDSPTTTSSLSVAPPPQPHPKLGKTTSAMTLEMLNQMASWNKMIAYINFGLLIFLLLLILGVVMSIHYYNLTNYYYNHPPEDHTPTTFISPLAA